MNYSGWQLFWCAVVLLALVSYFGLAVVIAIGGAFDLRKMFKRLSAPHESDLQNAVTADVPADVANENSDTDDSLG
jgi:hypothetical protein